ncbi:MAG: hypothetical protein ACN6PO_07420, partial [Stenotrophomonas bentonitica]
MTAGWRSTTGTAPSSQTCHETVVYWAQSRSDEQYGGHVQKRILIVDDEPAIREMVAFALRKGDY